MKWHRWSNLKGQLKPRDWMKKTKWDEIATGIAAAIWLYALYYIITLKDIR